MAKYLIDAHGKFWAADSCELAAQLGWHSPNDAFVDYAVRNIGYVFATDFGRHCRIELHPNTVSSGAYASLVMWLLEERFHRIGLFQHDRKLGDEIVGDAMAAVKRLTEIVQARDGTNATEFLSKPASLMQLPTTHPFRDLLDLWKSTTNDHALAHFEIPLDNLVNARYIISKVEPCSSLVFHSVGPGVQIYNESWYRSTVGLRVQDQPNYALGRWAAEAYRDTIIADEPRFDDVDLIIKRPRQTTKHICYKRMILPLSGTMRGALCVTLLDPTINLRVGTEQVSKDVIN